MTLNQILLSNYGPSPSSYCLSSYYTPRWNKMRRIWWPSPLIFQYPSIGIESSVFPARSSLTSTWWTNSSSLLLICWVDFIFFDTVVTYSKSFFKILYRSSYNLTFDFNSAFLSWLPELSYSFSNFRIVNIFLWRLIS